MGLISKVIIICIPWLWCSSYVWKGFEMWGIGETGGKNGKRIGAPRPVAGNSKVAAGGRREAAVAGLTRCGRGRQAGRRPPTLPCNEPYTHTPLYKVRDGDDTQALLADAFIQWKALLGLDSGRVRMVLLWKTGTFCVYIVWGGGDRVGSGECSGGNVGCKSCQRVPWRLECLVLRVVERCFEETEENDPYSV